MKQPPPSKQDFPLLAVHMAQQRASSSDRIVQFFFAALPPPLVATHASISNSSEESVDNYVIMC